MEDRDYESSVTAFELLIKSGILTGDEEGGCLRDRIARLDPQIQPDELRADCEAVYEEDSQ